MSKFIFSLEALLNHRLHHEEVIQKEMAECELGIRNVKSIVIRIQENKDRITEEIYEKQLQGISISEHRLYHEFLEGLSVKLVLHDAKVKELEKKCEEKRNELIEAVKKRKTLEKLKEKGLVCYSMEMLRLDQNFSDEVAISRYCKKAP